MKPVLNHENLDVYHLALASCAEVEPWIESWDPKHAVCDQWLRAAESIVENIAAASAAHSRMKQTCPDYALGSALECTACCDIAGMKALLTADQVAQHKENKLAPLFRMLVRLRQAWLPGTAREETSAYEPGPHPVLFHHEQLDMYRAALELMRSFCANTEVAALPVGAFRKLDGLATGVVLNIAEGNGRFSEIDHKRFMDIAHGSAVKLCAQLDLCVLRKLLPKAPVEDWKVLLSRVAAMTAAMMR